LEVAMIELPLAAEIREARQLAQEANDAALHLRWIELELGTLRVLQGHLRPGVEPDLDLPGDATLEALLDRWPMLHRIGDVAPADGAPFTTRLDSRRIQLDTARQMLAPLAAAARTRNEHLSDLLHEQNHDLEDPKFGPALEELGELWRQRELATMALAPLEERASRLEPLLTTSRAFRDRLSGELDALRPDDAVGAFRAAHLGLGLLGTLEGIALQLGQPLDFPRAPSVPDIPSPEGLPALRAAVADMVDAFRRLAESLQAEFGNVRTEADALAGQVASIEDRIHGLTG
jgi:hypothetical protein